MPVPEFRAFVDSDGRLLLAEHERDQRRIYLQSLAGTVVDVIVKPHTDTRSQRANAYYWSCVLTVMSHEHSGGDQSPEEIHDAMCERFLPNEHKRIEFFHHMTGEVLAIDTDTRRSSKLTGEAFYAFVEQVRKFALEFLGITTEDPDPEYWRKRDRAA